MPSGYQPDFYASQVLPNGNVLVEGGEYNGGSGDWTNKGAIYDPVADKWTAVNPPSAAMVPSTVASASSASPCRTR